MSIPLNNKNTSFLSGNDLLLVRSLFSQVLVADCDVRDIAMRGMRPLTKPSSRAI